MTLEGLRVWLLCEDAAHERFARTYLRTRGVNTRQLFPLPLTSRGSGEHYVRTKYAREVRALRARGHDAQVALVVVTDADQGTVAARRASLEEALHTDGLAARTPVERIVLLIPKRNVETWVTYLNGNAVDESADYKPQTPEAFKLAAKGMPEACSATQPAADRPPSLVDGCSELRRLDA